MKQDHTKVTGANVSVKISDDFMHAVEDNGKFTLHSTQNQYTATTAVFYSSNNNDFQMSKMSTI